MRKSEQSGFRVLISDHNESQRKPLAAYLASKGCIVDETCSGSAAWALLRSRPYDLVVLEMELRDVNGLELLRLMRRLNPSPLALLVADWKTEAVERMALALGAEDFFVKPYELADVHSLLIDRSRDIGDQSAAAGS